MPDEEDLNTHQSPFDVWVDGLDWEEEPEEIPEPDPNQLDLF